MDRVKKKYEDLKKALATFEEVLVLYKNKCEHGKMLTDSDELHAHEQDLQVYCDSIVQRFEYSIDGLWKYLQGLLIEKHNITLDVSTPRTVLRACAKAGLISEQESEACLEMMRIRNLTSHIYRQEIADEIVKRAREYFQMISAVVEKCEP